MPKPLQLHLSDAEREQLLHIRDYHPKPYFRERAAALLKSPLDNPDEMLLYTD